jgi:glycosyltransferase involved in cell wall biosynthesis
MSNRVNSDLLKEFYHHMKDNGTSQNYQKGNLKAMIHFAEYIGAATSFYKVDHEQVIRFLDAKIKHEQVDFDKKWITTWNDYLWRLKLFFRWLHNKKIREMNGQEAEPEDEWETPSFCKKIDLEEIGFKKLYIVPHGLNVTPLSNVKQKEANPTVGFIGRLNNAKLPHHALQAFQLSIAKYMMQKCG